MEQEINPNLIAPVSPEFFLPPINRWLSWGGIVMLSGVISAIAFAGVFKYRVTVKAPAKIRPEGEIRLVQAAKSGKIAKIAVKPYQQVQKEDIIAYLDDFALQQDRQQIQNTIKATQQQIEQLQALITSKETQINAERQQVKSSIATLESLLSLEKNNYQNQQINLSTSLKTAIANFDLAEDELTRYQKLVETGAIATLQLKEKEAAYRNAEAQLQKATAQLNPSDEPIQIATKKIAQATTEGDATIARLQQEKQALLPQKIQLEEQLNSDRQKLRKIEADLDDLIIRATASGTIQELNLRNNGQVINQGNAIAQIAPSESSLTIKAAVATSEISRVKIGQLVRMRVASCPYTDYGILSAKVIAISPDAIDRSNSVINSAAPNNTVYEVTIQPQNTVLHQATRQCTIQAGMNGRADIITEEETLLRYLVRKLKIR